MSVGKLKKKQKNHINSYGLPSYSRQKPLPKRQSYWYDIKGYCRGTIFCFYWKIFTLHYHPKLWLSLINETEELYWFLFKYPWCMILPVFRYRFITHTSLFPAILLQGGKMVLCKKKIFINISPTSLLGPVLLFWTQSHSKLDRRGESGPGRPPQTPLGVRLFFDCLLAWNSCSFYLLQLLKS